MKTILITGATDGIGLCAAKKLSGLGHKILVHGRDAAKLDKALSDIGGASEAYLSDLSDMVNVQKLARDIAANHSRLDVLINNAGILKTPTTRTKADRDIRFDVNTIAPFILTQNLLPIMPKDGRIINLSSAAQAPVDTDAMMRFCAMDDMEAYAQSKLAITIWSQELAKDYPDGPVFVAVNPGSLLATKMVQEGFGVPGKDLNIGADILVNASLAVEFVSASGQYFDNDNGVFAAPHQDAENSAKVAEIMQSLSDIANDLSNA